MQRSLRQRCKSGTTERSDGKGRRNCDRRAALGVSRTAIPRRQTYCRRLGHAERAEGSKQKISCADRYRGASMKVLITGAAGFINGYLISDLLAHGYEVVGIDNFSKYGRLKRSFDDNPKYRLVEGDAKDVGLLEKLLQDCDHFVASAAM